TASPRFSASVYAPFTSRERYKSIPPLPPERPEPKYTVPSLVRVGKYSFASLLTGAPRLRGALHPLAVWSITQISSARGAKLDELGSGRLEIKNNCLPSTVIKGSASEY